MMQESLASLWSSADKAAVLCSSRRSAGRSGPMPLQGPMPARPWAMASCRSLASHVWSPLFLLKAPDGHASLTAEVLIRKSADMTGCQWISTWHLWEPVKDWT